MPYVECFFFSSCCSLLVVPCRLFSRERGFTATAVLLVDLCFDLLNIVFKLINFFYIKVCGFQVASLMMITIQAPPSDENIYIWQSDREILIVFRGYLFAIILPFTRRLRKVLQAVAENAP